MPVFLGREPAENHSLQAQYDAVADVFDGSIILSRQFALVHWTKFAWLDCEASLEYKIRP